jgi:hypothetical protein
LFFADNILSAVVEHEYSKDDLLMLLHLSDKYDIEVGLQYVRKQINAQRWHWEATDLVKISLTVRNSSLFEHAFGRLVKLPLHDLSIEHLNNLNSVVLSAALKAQHAIQQHCHIIAAEPPPVNHSKSCPDRSACDADWHAIWWNRIARCLLDGRHLLEWDDAFSLFKTMEFGDMHSECYKGMLKETRSGEGLKSPISDIIKDVTTQLSKYYFPEPVDVMML